MGSRLWEQGAEAGLFLFTLKGLNLKPCSAGAVGPQRMLQKRFKMGQSATRVRNRILRKKKTDFCLHQVHQMLEGHHEQQGGLEEFVRAQGGAHTAGKVCSSCCLTFL